MGLLLVPDNGLQIHDDRSGLSLPRRQDRYWNRTGPCFLDHKPIDVWQRFASFRYASLVLFCTAACSSKKCDRYRDGYFSVEVTHALDSHSVVHGCAFASSEQLAGLLPARMQTHTATARRSSPPKILAHHGYHYSAHHPPSCP